MNAEPLPGEENKSDLAQPGREPDPTPQDFAPLPGQSGIDNRGAGDASMVATVAAPQVPEAVHDPMPLDQETRAALMQPTLPGVTMSESFLNPPTITGDVSIDRLVAGAAAQARYLAGMYASLAYMEAPRTLDEAAHAIDGVRALAHDTHALLSDAVTLIGALAQHFGGGGRE